MSQLLFEYERIAPTTWAYLSSLLMIGLFFMFNRIWSVRNLDLVLLAMLSPGLLLVYDGRQRFHAAEAAYAETVAAAESAGEVATGDGSTLTAAPIADTTDSASPSPDELAADSSIANRSAADTEATNANTATNSEAADETANESIDSEVVGSDSTPLAPEQIAMQQARGRELFGFLWLLGVNLCLLIRLLIDPTMVRRPLLEPNLSTGGLGFIGCSLFVFLMANVITSTAADQYSTGPVLGPGYSLMDMLPAIPTTPEFDSTGADQPVEPVAYATAARLLAIFSQLAVVVGIVGIGYRHFANLRTGIGVATLYLMLPYTAQMTGRVDHVLPAAFLIWAVLWYRRPLVAGLFLGLASGVVYYPLFLLPLWISFYWQRGLGRFLAGFAATIGVLVMLLALTADDFGAQIQRMFGLWLPFLDGLEGVWGLGWHPIFRLPVLAAFIAFSGLFAFWPAQKNLGSLMSCSAAVMVAAQFWHGYGGGLYMAWYLPMLLLTIFRPNLEDRVALVVLGESWLRRHRLRVAAMF